MCARCERFMRCSGRLTLRSVLRHQKFFAHSWIHIPAWESLYIYLFFSFVLFCFFLDGSSQDCFSLKLADSLAVLIAYCFQKMKPPRGLLQHSAESSFFMCNQWSSQCRWLVYQLFQRVAAASSQSIQVICSHGASISMTSQTRNLGRLLLKEISLT